MGRGEASDKKRYSVAEWEKKLANITIRKEDMNKLVMNFLVTEGYIEAAQIFQKESGTSPEVLLSSITDRTEIRKAVQNGNIEEAIAKVNDFNPEILEEDEELSFHLHQQRLIELIRAGKTEEALDFAQEYLAPRGEEDPVVLQELESTVALLAFEDPTQSPVSHLLDISQRQRTASELNAAILHSQNQDEEARLPNLLKMLRWAETQLEGKIVYPHIKNWVSGELEEPPPEP